MLIKELSFPRAMNLHLLECLGEEALKQLIIANSRKSRLDRRIVLPSQKCLKKVLFHRLYIKHQGDLDKITIELRNGFKTLKELNISRKKVEMFYKQRQKEILIEQERC